MSQSSTGPTHSIEVSEILPHRRSVVWRALTEADLIERWLMKPEGFKPSVGQRFTFTTKPAGAWDGTIHCEVLEVVENERLSYRWSGGHDSNIGYGAPLETIVTMTLVDATGGTHLKIVHSGFELPRNESAYRTMSDGWRVVAQRLETVVAEKNAKA